MSIIDKLIGIFSGKCFFCGGIYNLQKEVHPGYYDTVMHYHQNCLDEVLHNPEKHVKFLDLAIQIHDEQDLRISREEQRLINERAKIETAKAIVKNQESLKKDKENPVLEKRFVPAFDIDKGTAFIDSIVEENIEKIENKSESENNSKFKQIFEE